MAVYDNGVVKVYDKQLRDINSNAEYILIPLGVEAIFLDSLKNYKAEYIKCPKTLKRIMDSSFSSFNNLKEIDINKELEDIGEGAFKNCISLKKIKIPNNVDIIRKETFFGCSELKEVVLPDKLEKIGKRAFENCTKLEKIILPKKLKEIGESAFSCCNIKEIEIPKSVETIESFAFKGNKNLKKIIIHYKNINTLKNVLNYFSIIGISVLSYGIEVTIVFNGPRLTDKEKEKIQSLIRKANGYNVSFVFEELDNVLIISEDEIELSNEEIIKDKEIRDLVNKILKISKNSPKEIKVLVETNLEKDLLKYKQDLLDAKPQFNLRKSNSTFGTINNIKSYKINLLAKLNSYIYNLNSLDNYIKDLDEVNNYLELLKITPQKDGKIIEDNRIDHNIINILINTLYLEEEDKTEFLDELKNDIISAKDGISLQIENSFNNNEQLVLNETDYKKELQLKVSKLYDRVKSISLKRKPFIDLYEVLDNTKEEYVSGNSIDKIINSILYVKTKIKNPEYQTEINNKLNATIKKYKDIINNTLKNESLMKNTHYSKIELGLRADLQEILEELSIDVYFDLYEQKNASIGELKKQLERSLRILNGQEIPSTKNKVSNGPIINFVIEVLIELKNNSVIDKTNKEALLNEFISILEEEYNKIKDIKFIKKKDYNHLLYEIFRIISSAKFGIIEYANELIDYHKYC